MFLIPTYVATSEIHGFGVFTAVPLRAGDVIWEFTDGVDLRLAGDDLQRLPPSLADRLRSYCYRERTGTYVLCGDAAKFMNHSPDPTCDDDGLLTVVRRDLTSGSELTCDYNVFDWDTILGNGESFTRAVGPVGLGHAAGRTVPGGRR